MRNSLQELTNDQYAILVELNDAQDWRGLTEREVEQSAGVRRGRLLNESLNGLAKGGYIRERHEKGHLFPTYYIITEKGRREIK